jgi:hypothetical protein
LKEGKMKKLFIVIPLVFLLCLTFGCQETEEAAEEVVAEQPAMDLAMVRQAIEEANLMFGEAVRAGDVATLVGLYTEDARLLPPNSEMIQGREGIGYQRYRVDHYGRNGNGRSGLRGRNSQNVRST